MIVLLHANPITDRERLYARKDRCAGVALFLGAVKILLIAGQIKDRLPLLHLCLLQAENIGIQFLEGLHEPLFERGTQTVDVP